MVDAVTNNYSITLPTVGGDSNTWGTVQNNGIFTPLDGILGANFSTTITNADVTLTTTQFQNAIFIVGGQLAAAHSLIIPFSPNISTVACGGKFIVVNNQSGAFNLTVKTATTGASVTVPQGFAASLYSDGTNVGFAGGGGFGGYAQASNGNPNNVLTGTAGSVNTNASLAWDYVNSLLYVSTGGSTWVQPTLPTIPRGFDTPVNLAFTTSVNSNLLTITAIAANTNTTPTLTNPIVFPFRDTTLAAGDVVTVNATGALSISTFSTGASLGSQNNTPFRLWIVAFNNAGAAVLGLINCSATTGNFGLNETGLASTSSIGSTATSTATFYTPNGVALTSKAFRIVGFVAYETGLVTAGTYNNGPTVTQLFSPGVKKPGDPIQTVQAIATGVVTTVSTTFVQTNMSASIAPTSAANPILITCYGLANAVGNGMPATQLARGTTLIGVPAGTIIASVPIPAPTGLLDLPATTALTAYSVYFKDIGGAGNVQWNGTSGGTQFGSIMTLQELMG